MQRRERRHRLLKDQADAISAYRTDFPAVLRQLQQIDRAGRGIFRIGEQHAAIHARRLGMDAHDGLADDGFSGAGLADESRDFSRKNAKARAPDGIDGAAHERKRDPQIFNTEQICACAHAKGFLAVSLSLPCDNLLRRA